MGPPGNPQPARACSKAANGPSLGLRPAAPGRKHQLPTDREPKGSRWAGGLVGRWSHIPRPPGWAGSEAPVLTGATRGNPSILYACNIQLSSRLVRSPASVGINADPPQDQVPRQGAGRVVGQTQGSGLPPELQEPWVSPSLDIAGPAQVPDFIEGPATGR